jgi:aspartyl-tRNA(Asn)/glutamyl-tRNA(Gln) amidotransferase subunit B
MTYVLREGIDRFALDPLVFGKFLRAVSQGDVPREAAKSIVLPEMLATGRGWEQIVKDRGLTAVKADDLEAVCRAVLAEKPDIVAKFREGKLGVKGVLVGEVMKRTKGSADAKRVNEVLERLLAAR